MKLHGLAMLCFVSPAMAQPMWDIAPDWACTLERHMRAPTGAEVVEMEPSGRSFHLDFEAMTVTSAFVDGTARIVQNTAHATDGITYNVIINAWPFGEFPSVFMEQDGVAWSVGGSGTLNEGDDVWVAIYRCEPSQPGS